MVWEVGLGLDGEGHGEAEVVRGEKGEGVGDLLAEIDGDLFGFYPRVLFH